ncbi:MAG: cation:proton antiporter [Gammaproteobacteria bacterium]|uniref:cation:proton antiporter n=1 Tax=Rhodoferax sp. TaxID=50421 RepID=UPI00185CA869|nr:cation:proton antiporter family protein [Rhodoferax sp.]MBU3900972.1 cation:proton antiporter [Gammaproteobacteria bacterium]MBA3058336.1 sodium:proton exchanger [Rhodoferax sp.]MBU3996799.1 cation:proton antiporter [Gammaproteobacteria bacterium]MBU4017646.1 cation:proton antiporter [Gammaproteobacteria bacterium]MBU4081089.1 cation:proton antiporter [Gammaproteobacteria bacterium]
MNDTYHEFALLLMLSAVVGAIAVRLRQPLLMAYIIVGIAVGPAAFGWVGAHDQINLLAQIGITVLLFVVGLKLDLRHVRQIGPVALATGLGQLSFTILFGFLIVLALGKGWLDALYIAIALTFSSTIIIVKLLSDKRELDSLHGRIAVGFLIVQDLAVVIAMMLMSGLGGIGSEAVGGMTLALSLLARLGGAAVLLYFLMRYVLPLVADTLARSQELLLIFAIAWGTALAALGEYAGFSKEAGAFVAGFSLASTAYREAISARLTSIRDFLLLFFFIDLGAKLDFSTLGEETGTALVLSLFVLIGNPLIVMAIMGYMGYRKRTSFLAGLTVAQISEFSIIFVAMGISLGHIGAGALGLTTLVGLITIALSSYMILYSHRLYGWLAPWLGPFERRTPFRELAVENAPAQTERPDILVFGLGRYGSRLALKLREQNMRVLGVDFDPEVIKAQQRTGLDARFGDCEAPEFIESLPLKDLPWIVSSLPDTGANRALISALAEHHYRGRIAIVARDEAESENLRMLGEVEVILPFNQAADFAALDLAARIASAEVPDLKETP